MSLTPTLEERVALIEVNLNQADCDGAGSCCAGYCCESPFEADHPVGSEVEAAVLTAVESLTVIVGDKHYSAANRIAASDALLRYHAAH